MPALTVYTNGTNSTTTGLTTLARKLATSSSGLTVSTPTTKVGKATGWDKISPQGSTANWAALGALAGPTGEGFILEDGTLDGATIAAGDWTGAVRLTGSTALTANVVARIFKRDTGGTYTLIADARSNGAVVIGTTATDISLSTTSTGGSTGVQMDFAAGDDLYIGVNLNITVAGTSNTGTVSISEGAGAVSSFTTPGYFYIAQGAVNLVAASSLTATQPTQTVTLEIWENGVFRSSLGTATVDAGDAIFDIAWDASVLSDLTNPNLELRIRASAPIDIAAVEFVAEFVGVQFVVYQGAASLAADGSLAVAGFITYLGAAPLIASSTFTAAGVRVALGTANLVASSSLTTSATRGVNAAASLTGSSALTAAGSVTELPSIGLTAASTLTPTSLVTAPAAAPLSASATLTTVGVRGVQAAATMTSASTLTIAGTREVAAVAALSAAAVLSARTEILGFANLAASSILTATPTIAAVSFAALAASAVLTAPATRGVNAAAALNASASLTSVGTRGVDVAASLAAATTLTVSSIITDVAVVSLAGNSTITVSVTVTAVAVANLSAAASITVTAVLTRLGAAGLTASSVLTVVGTRGVDAVAAFTASGSLTTSAVLTALASAALTSTASLTTAAFATAVALTVLNAAATLSTGSFLVTAGIAAMTAAASLTFTIIGYRIASIPPDTILVQTNLTGSLVNVRDDPDANDGIYWIASGSGEVRLGFEKPNTDQSLRPGPGRQEFRVLLRPGT